MDAAVHGFEQVPIDGRVFAHPRLEIVGMVACAGGVTFRRLCEATALTDGNLSAHLRTLEIDGVISVERTTEGGRRCSVYQLTEDGRARFCHYVAWLASFAGAMHLHCR